MHFVPRKRTVDICNVINVPFFTFQNSSNQDNSVLVICATNRPDVLDPALCRPGRLDQVIYVPPPDEVARLAILKSVLRNMSVEDDLDIGDLANATEGFSGADLENLCREAALHALTENGFAVETVNRSDFDAVLRDLRPSITQDMLRKYEQYQRLGSSNS